MTDTIWIPTNDIISGDTIRWAEGVFSGSYRKPKFQGNRTNVGLVVADSYGSKKQQHTFTVKVTESSGHCPITVGQTICRKGRNVYRHGADRKPWASETARDEVAREKHVRGDAARASRADRVALEFQL